MKTQGPSVELRDREQDLKRLSEIKDTDEYKKLRNELTEQYVKDIMENLKTVDFNILEMMK